MRKPIYCQLFQLLTVLTGMLLDLADKVREIKSTLEEEIKLENDVIPQEVLEIVCYIKKEYSTFYKILINEHLIIRYVRRKRPYNKLVVCILVSKDCSQDILDNLIEKSPHKSILDVQYYKESSVNFCISECETNTLIIRIKE